MRDVDLCSAAAARHRIPAVVSMPPPVVRLARKIRKPLFRRRRFRRRSRPDISWNSRTTNPSGTSNPRWPELSSMQPSHGHRIRRQCSPQSEIAAMRKTAEADPKVAALLGDRWGFIDADRLAPEGKIAFGCCRNQARFDRLTYFSYSNNVAIDVRMKDMTVLEASRHEGYLPAEGPQDVQRGIELARADARLAGKVQALAGTWAPDAAGSWFFQK